MRREQCRLSNAIFAGQGKDDTPVHGAFPFLRYAAARTGAEVDADGSSITSFPSSHEASTVACFRRISGVPQFSSVPQFISTESASFFCPRCDLADSEAHRPGKDSEAQRQRKHRPRQIRCMTHLHFPLVLFDVVLVELCGLDVGGTVTCQQRHRCQSGLWWRLVSQRNNLSCLASPRNKSSRLVSSRDLNYPLLSSPHPCRLSR
jgi:hypothetical protein